MSPNATNFAAYDTAHASLRRQILRECEEMAEHAFASGLRVPAQVMQVVEAAVAASLQAQKETGADEPYDATGEEIRRLTQAHEQLAKIVAPATPRGLVILADSRNDGSLLGALGPVPFIRHMMVVAIVSLIAFITLASISWVDGDVHIGKTVEEWWKVLGNEVFLICAAAMGASFASLFQANQYIASRNYDPQHEVSYWIKFVVGLMAGLMLCLLIPLDLGAESTTADALEKPLLALLGGFSASAVHRILNRLVETVESLVRGSSKEMLAAAEEQARVQAQAQTEQMRLRMASSLMSIQQQMNSGTHPDEVRARLDGMLNGMIPDRVDEIAPAAAAPANGNGNGAYNGNGAFASEVVAGNGGGAYAPTNRIAPHLTEVVDDEPDGVHHEPGAPANLGAYHGEDESDDDEHEEHQYRAPQTPTAFIPIVGIKPATPAGAGQEDDDAVG